MRDTTSRKSVRSPGQRSPGQGRESQRTMAGRLVAVTATGSIFQSPIQLSVVPVSVGLAFLQELAARVLDPKAPVVATRAQYLSGRDALVEWSRTSAIASVVLLNLKGKARVRYLMEVLTYVRRKNDAAGIEPVLCAAINAAWPWLEPRTLGRILRSSARYLASSKFASRVSVPVLDVTTRTFALYRPGELARIDIERWLDWLEMLASGLGGVTAPSANHGTADNVYGPGGLLGPGMPGHKGLDLSGLPGPDGKPRGATDDLDAGLYGPGGLLGPGTPGHKGLDLSGLPGADGKPRGAPSDDIGLYGPDGLLGPGIPGHHGIDLTNLRGNGGPYGHGAALAPGGVETPEDEKLAKAKQEQSFGQALFIAGIGASIAGVAAAGLGSPAAIPLAIGAVVLLVAGGSLYISGERTELKHERDKPPIPTDGKKHLYPDPFGDGGGTPNTMWDEHGGGGSPNTIWDENGGGGSPDTIWDENGGGGSPNTIWDENGGGGTPTTSPIDIPSMTLVGRGLLARIEQVGPQTFAF